MRKLELLIVVLLTAVLVVQSIHLHNYFNYVDTNWCEAEVDIMKHGVTILVDHFNLGFDETITCTTH